MADPLDLGWPAVAVRAGVGLVCSVLIEEVVTPHSVGGRAGTITNQPYSKLKSRLAHLGGKKKKELSLRNSKWGVNWAFGS